MLDGYSMWCVVASASLDGSGGEIWNKKNGKGIEIMLQCNFIIAIFLDKE